MGHFPEAGLSGGDGDFFTMIAGRFLAAYADIIMTGLSEWFLFEEFVTRTQAASPTQFHMERGVVGGFRFAIPVLRGDSKSISGYAIGACDTVTNLGRKQQTESVLAVGSDFLVHQPSATINRFLTGLQRLWWALVRNTLMVPLGQAGFFSNPCRSLMGLRETESHEYFQIERFGLTNSEAKGPLDRIDSRSVCGSCAPSRPIYRERRREALPMA